MGVRLKLTPESQATIRYWMKEMAPEFKSEVITPWVNELGRKWKEQMEGAFVEEATPQGPPWKALTARYAAWKMRHGYPDLIGTRTGALSRSMYKTMTPARATVEVGSGGVEYAKYFNRVRSFFPSMRNAENDAYGVFNSKVRRFARKVNGGA